MTELNDEQGLQHGELQPWDREALRRLRTGDIAVLLEGRPLARVLQHAGQAVLAAAGSGDDELVRRCVAGLLERDAAGDDVLAMELQAMLGEAVTSEHLPWPLTAVPVSLDMLSGVLDGDPLQGDGALDLATGNVYPPGSLDTDPPEELDEDSELFDPDRWLRFQPECGAAYRDMVDFAVDLPDGRCRERLFEALKGVARSAVSVTCSTTTRAWSSSPAGSCSRTSASSAAPASGSLWPATAAHPGTSGGVRPDTVQP